ncbi:PAS/PAC sensor signal transduction histidine kinase [Fibrisoma limi BUZ 3]|uniref:histidine kinase n=1 Tax=Fibrisoma limi BUZ 3 TaxID=1185876 RepID=I2GSP7_9BACT|nr:PAS domain-containing protein [Fibrisoma limi]CCH56926.1 PAS/PAC sensor signal transduction histidine kinase [Fibrisoma limi BUZ 3]
MMSSAQPGAFPSQLFQHIVDDSRVGVVILEAIRNEQGEFQDFIFSYINPAGAAILGHPADALSGQSYQSSFSQAINSDLLSAYQQVLETGEALRIPEVHYAANGAKRWFDLGITRYGEAVVVTFTDIFTTKQVGESDRQNRFMDGVFNVTNEAIYVLEAIRENGPGPTNPGSIVDFRYQRINQAFERMFGSRADVIIGQNYLKLFPTVKTSGLFDRFCAVVETGQPFQQEVFYDGEGICGWYELTVVKLDDGVVGTTRDITIRKQAQLDNQKQAAFRNQILQISSSGVIAYQAIRNPEGVITDFRTVFFNQAYEQIFNESAERIANLTFKQRFVDLASVELFNFYINITETGEAFRRDRYYPHLGKWLNLAGTHLEDGFLIIVNDITDLKRATEQLQTVIDQAHTGIIMIRPLRVVNSDQIEDFTISLVNRSQAEYLGLTPGELVGQLASKHFTTYKANGLFDRYRQVIETGEPQHFEHHYEGDGIDVWVDIQAIPLNGEVLITFWDHTAMKSLQRQLETKVLELSKANENLQQFAYAASHDLQEPLRKVQSFCDVIVEQYGPQVGENGRDMMRRMQGAAGRMQVLIRDLLAYSRTATHQQALEPIDLNSLVTNVLSDLDVVIQETGAQIRIEALPIVPGDRLQLGQLVQNFLSNALKFRRLDETPVIEVGAKEASLGVLPEPLRLKGGRYVALTIRDNGIGFDTRYEDRIFGLFQRLHGRSQYEGSGIGLAICKRVAENHGGTITVESKIGEGTEFTVYLPM